MIVTRLPLRADIQCTIDNVNDTVSLSVKGKRIHIGPYFGSAPYWVFMGTDGQGTLCYGKDDAIRELLRQAKVNDPDDSILTFISDRWQ